MKRVSDIFADLRPALLGTAATAANSYSLLDTIGKSVSIAVGLVTLIYLAIRILKEIRR